MLLVTLRQQLVFISITSVFLVAGLVLMIPALLDGETIIRVSSGLDAVALVSVWGNYFLARRRRDQIASTGFAKRPDRVGLSFNVAVIVVIAGLLVTEIVQFIQGQ